MTGRLFLITLCLMTVLVNLYTEFGMISLFPQHTF